MSNNMQLSYNADGTAIYMPLGPPTSSPSPAPAYNNPNGAGGGGGYTGENNSVGASGSDAVKRKRGRPRKYAPGETRPPAATLTSKTQPPPGYAAAESSDIQSPPVSSTAKKARGRPPGSGNKQHSAASGSAGAGFMPHVLDVQAGEDVLAKLMRFSQNITRAFCILSATGAISSVTIQQTATSGGTVTYEGRFEILSLKGSFLASESGGQQNRLDGLSVALSGPDGGVLGGNVAGLLTAASPIQVIIGSFIPAIQKQSKAAARGSNEAEIVNPVSGGGSLSESSGGDLGSPMERSNNGSNPQGMGMANMPWR